LSPPYAHDRFPTSLTKISSAQRAAAYYQQINTNVTNIERTAMRLIVMRAVPFNTTQQRRLTQRPDSFDVRSTETDG
jgi:hypothetical protein